MSNGPIDLIAIQFENNTYTGKVMDELEALVTAKTIKILDLIFVSRNMEGETEIVELTDLPDALVQRLDTFVDEIDALLSHDDARALASGLAPGALAALLIYENVWAREFTAAVKEIGGDVLLAERIPQSLFVAMQENPAS